MTYKEYQGELLPLLSGLFKGLVSRPPRNTPAGSFEEKASQAANRLIWDILGGYELDAVCNEAKALASEGIEIRRGQDSKVILYAIRRRVAGENHRPAAQWSPCNEAELYRLIERNSRLPNATAEWTDPAWVMQETFGFVASDRQRQDARDLLNSHIDEMRRSAIGRGRMPVEAQEMFPYYR